MGKIGLIIKREYLTRVKKKSFIILTILGPLLMLGFLVAAVMLGMKDEGHVKVLILDETIVSNKFDFEDDEKFTFRWFEREEYDYGKAIEKFESSDYNYMIYLPENIIGAEAAQLVYKKAPSSRTEAFLNRLTNRFVERLKLEEANISLEKYNKLKTDVNLKLLDVDKSKDPLAAQKENRFRERAGVGYGFAILIYIFIFMYAVQVMRGVIEEKQNRIVEVIISSVKPFQLMMGKIIGVAMVGLTQFLIWIIFSAIIFTIATSFFIPNLMDAEVQSQLSNGAMQMSQQDIMNNDIIQFIYQINWPLMIGLFLFYFIGGYLLYSSLMAAIGAAVDNETDTQQFMLPVTLPLIFGFLIAQMTIENPEGAASVWFAQIPFTSPVVMMVKVAMGVGEGVSVLEIISSMILLVVAFILTTMLAAKIYRIGILMYGKKASWKELMKWVFYKD